MRIKLKFLLHIILLWFITTITVVFSEEEGKNYKSSKQLNKYLHDITNLKLTTKKQKACMNAYFTKSVIGESKMGTKIFKYVFKNNRNTETQNYKNVKVLLMGNIHGNEISGRQLLIKMIEELSSLCKTKKGEGDKKKLKWKKIIKDGGMELTIIPSVNPDGFDERWAVNNCCDDGTKLEEYCISSTRSFWEKKRDIREHDKECRDWRFSKLTQKLWTKGRYAKHNTTGEFNVDMNRDFPDVAQIYFDKEAALFDKVLINDKMNGKNKMNDDHTYFNAKESKMLDKEVFEKNIYDYAISYHDGAQVVSYGMDKSLGRFGVEPKDTDLFKHLSKIYARDVTVGCQSEYKNPFRTGEAGVTNGAEWYSIIGTSTDYQYVKYGTIPLTIEMSCNKFSPKEVIDQEGGLLDMHKRATFSFLQSIIRSAEPSSSSNVLLVGSSKKLLKCSKCDQKRVFFTHVDSKITYSTVPDKFGRFRKPLMQHGAYKISVRAISQTQARNKMKHNVKYDLSFAGRKLFNMESTFLDLRALNRTKWLEIEQKLLEN